MVEKWLIWNPVKDFLKSLSAQCSLARSFRRLRSVLTFTTSLREIRASLR